MLYIIAVSVIISLQTGATYSNGCREGSVRLVGPDVNVTRYGRLEICSSGLWHSVCADGSFCSLTAKVICRQLGLSITGAQAYGLALFGEGNGTVGYQNVSCTGNELNITQCNYTTPSTCSHEFDGGVLCNPQAICLDVGGFSSCCDTYHCYISYPYNCWCDELCHSMEVTPFYNNNEYGQGLEDVYSKTVSCYGNESQLLDCKGYNSCCGHQYDIGVSCESSCTSGTIRLVGGPTDREGRVEVCHNGRWGTICDKEWDIYDAYVICRTMGLPWRGAQAFTGGYTSSVYGSGTTGQVIWIEDIECTGEENQLSECVSEDQYGDKGNCQHSNDVSMICAPGPCALAGYNETCCDPSTGASCQGVNPNTVCHCSLDCEDHNDCCIDAHLICQCHNYDLRLAGGTVPNEGRVEMCYEGEWGTICDDYWDNLDAQVVCRQLGYLSTGAQGFRYAYFGEGTGPIYLDDVQCRGIERKLIYCKRKYWGHNCRHYEDASVRCPIAPECTSPDIRLANGENSFEGELQICHNGAWSKACITNDYLYVSKNALVACRTIFGSTRVSTFYFSYSWWSSGSPGVGSIRCNGYESNLANCFDDYNTYKNCPNAVLTCYPQWRYAGQPMLIPGPQYGRLLVSVDDTWGTVCKDLFDVNDAGVVCTELGLPASSPRVYRDGQFGADVRTFSGDKFGPGIGPVQFKDINCTGNETNLKYCTVNTDTSDCSHDEDSGLRCDGDKLVNDTRIGYMPNPLPSPGFITNSSISVLNNTAVEIHWNKPHNGQSVPVQYNITIGSRTVSVIGSEYNAIISNLSPGVLYSYQVVVSNIFGPGLPQTSNHFFTAELAPVGAVTIQSVEWVNDYTVQLVWSPLALTEARGFINNYNINISSYVNGTCGIEPVATDSAPANNNDTNSNINHTIATRGGVMVPSLMYCVTITANNSIGTGPNSSPFIINVTSFEKIQLIINLLNTDTCDSWSESNKFIKMHDIINAVTMAIQERCYDCQFSSEYINNRRFTCTREEGVVLFSANLYSTSTSRYLQLMEDWLSAGNATLNVNGQIFKMDTTCNDERQFGFNGQFCIINNDDNNNLIISISSGAGGTILIIIILISVFVTSGYCFYKKKRLLPHKSNRLDIDMKKIEE
uniref:Uncharacterized protein n=1 Tax=Amphimedon queenslandica TaxID=400682 RepID=A0A1X7T885_AMPQE